MKVFVFVEANMHCSPWLTKEDSQYTVNITGLSVHSEEEEKEDLFIYLFIYGRLIGPSDKKMKKKKKKKKKKTMKKKTTKKKKAKNMKSKKNYLLN